MRTVNCTTEMPPRWIVCAPCRLAVRLCLLASLLPAFSGCGAGSAAQSSHVTEQAAIVTQEVTAASAPIDPDTMIDITFDDLKLDMSLGTLFDRSMLTPRAAQLDGQRVRLRGFIFAGGVFQQTGIESFPFVMNTECKFGPQGYAYCVILVQLNPGVTTDFTTYPVTVEGKLTVRPFDSDGFTWSVYHMQGERVWQ